MADVRGKLASGREQVDCKSTSSAGSMYGERFTGLVLPTCPRVDTLCTASADGTFDVGAESAEDVCGVFGARFDVIL